MMTGSPPTGGASTGPLASSPEEIVPDTYNETYLSRRKLEWIMQAQAGLRRRRRMEMIGRLALLVLMVSAIELVVLTWIIMR